MGSLQGGCIVDAVPRHRDDFAIGFERLHKPQLLLGNDAREDVDLRHALAQLRIGHGVELRPGHDRFWMRQADLSRDGLRRAGVVAGDHYRAYPRGIAFSQRRRNCRPNGVGEPGKAEEAQAQLALRRRPRTRVAVRRRERAARHRQHAQAVVCHLGDLRPNLRALIAVQLTHFRDCLSGSLGSHHIAVAALRLPDMGDGELLGRQWIRVAECPRIELLDGHGRALAGELVVGFLHRIEGLSLARQQRDLEELGWKRALPDSRYRASCPVPKACEQPCGFE